MMQLLQKLAVTALFVLAALLITPIALIANPYDTPTDNPLAKNKNLSNYTTLACADLVISAYVEGTGQNKYLEIFNGTDAPVILDGYAINIYTDGSLTVTANIALTGILPANEYFLVAHPDANMVGLTPNMTSAMLDFDGDDAVALVRNEILGTTTLDVVGTIGTQTEWIGTTCTQGTMDGTLVKKANAADPCLYQTFDGLSDFSAAIDNLYDCDDNDAVTMLNSYVQPATTISFVNAENLTTENAGTYLLCIGIENADGVNATTAEIDLVAGDSTKLGDYETQTITFAAGSAADECVTVTITDNSFCLGNEEFGFEIKNITGGNAAIVGANPTTILMVEDDELEMLDVAKQDFEGTAEDNWAVTPTPATYNTDGDVWGLVATLGGINPSSGSQFWGMQDLNNLNGGGAFDHILEFAAVDITGREGGTISFDYNVFEFDTGDNFRYEVYFDGVGQGEVALITGDDATPVSTNGWTTEMIEIPSGTTNVSLQIRVIQNGGDDRAGVDNVAVKMPGCSCLADAGDITTTTATSDFTLCEGEDLLDDAMVSAVFIADFGAADETDAGEGYEYVYLLIDNATGTIVENNTDGDFDFSNKNAGTYAVYGFSYWIGNDPNTADVYLNNIIGDADADDVAQIQNDGMSEDFCLDFSALDANGLPVLIEISENITITLAKTDITECGATDGEITISGLENGTIYNVSYTVDGNTTGPDALTANTDNEIILSNLAAGDYAVTVELNGCSDTENTTLTEPNAPTYAVSQENNPVICGGTGSIVLNGLEANTTYEIAIDNGTATTNTTGNTNMLGELSITASAGNYSIVLTLNNCEGEAVTASLTEPASPTPTIADFQNPSTCNAMNGAITIGNLVSNITYEITYEKDGTGGFSTLPQTANGDGEIFITNLTAGEYTNIVVRDQATTCPGQPLEQTLVDPTPPTLTETHVNPACGTSSTGSIDLTVMDGSGDYNYLWSTVGGTGLNPTSEDQENLSPATYSVTVTDNVSDCTATLDVTLTGGEFTAPAEMEDVEACESETIVLAPNGGGQSTEIFTDDLLFSEYIEGTDGNKCIEIYNGTGADVDLSIYEIEIYANGSVTANSTIELAGTLANRDVFVICNNDADAAFLAVSNTTTGGISFNGNDAVVLTKNTLPVDIFGNIGCNPGTEWSEGDHSTLNQTLVRNPNITSGIATDNLMDCPFPTLASEWKVLPTDHVSELGKHDFIEFANTPPAYNFYDADPADGGNLLATALTYEVPVPDVVPADGQPYSIFITAADEEANCESEASTEVSITVFPNPTANPTPASSGICLGSSKEFDANPTSGTAPFSHNWEITGGDATGVVLENNTSQVVSVNTENATNGMVEITYTIEDSRGCVADPIVMMIEIGDCDAMISDPCACLNNATNTENGQFSEEVEITGPAGQMWTVVAVAGLFQTNSAAPPAAPTPIMTGAMFTEVSPGVYHLDGIHVDANGYTLTAEEAGGQQLTISNTCFYSDPMITGLDDPICLFTEPFSLTFDANGVDGTASFTINGNPETEVNPMELGVGTHTVELTFDAGEALGYLLVDGMVEGAPDFAETLEEAMADPGCEQSVSMTFEIEDTPVQVTCNDHINLSLDENCEALVTPDMMLEGSYNCYDDYGITIKKNNFQTVPNPITGEFIGDLLTVKVTHLPSGNSCHGTVTVEDKLAPFFATCPDATVECYEDPAAVPAPEAVDNCSPNPIVTMVDEVTDDSDECDGVEIVQTFLAEDEHGNQSSTCQRTIFIPTPGLPDLPGDATWSCDDYAQFPTITDATELTGNLATTGSGVPTKIDGTYCNYAYSHADDTLSSCGNTFKIIRTWTILNWCTNELVTMGGNGEDNVQVIAVRDETPPVIDAEPVTVSANINGDHPQPCRSTGYIPPATVTDNCSDFTVKIFTPIGEVEYANGVDGEFGGNIPAPGLTLGEHTIVYSVQDICGNISEFPVTLTVIDDIVPVAICDFITSVNLTNDGTAVVFAETFDDGSYDNCCLEDFSVRRMTDNCGVSGNTSFGPTVTFCCADIEASPILVAFQAEDCFGNTNECMVQVNVDDKLAPSILTCPAPQSITCDTYNSEYEAALIACGEIQPGMSNEERRAIFECRNEVLNAEFGEPLFYDNCDFDINPTVVINLDQCDAGNITRTWRAEDGQGQFSPVCSQVITVNHVSDFEVRFPEDYEVNDCTGNDDFEPSNLPEPFDRPEIFFETCELIATSHEDQIFTIVNDACYKIVRTWTVINWCTVGDEVADEIEDPFVNGRYRDGGDGYIQEQQQIKINDTTAPILTCEDEIPVCIIEECMVDFIIPEPEAEDCSEEIDFMASGDLGSGFAFQDVGVGSYEMTITATDNCGNSSACNTTIVVSDCKFPTPYCREGAVIELGNIQPPSVDIWAEDMDIGSFDNCGLLDEPFGIELLGAGGEVIDGSPTTQGLTFGCDHVGTQLVRIWVTDIYGLQDFCTTFVEVQDNMNQCPNNLALGGRVETTDNEGINEVEMFVSGEMSSVTMTNMEGAYIFDNLIEGGDYTIVPQKDINPRNGVTTLDLVYIKKHVLNTELLSSPYQLIAADANNSGSVTTLDMVEIQKLILITIPTFQNNTSWRFIPQDYVFPNPENPWQEFFPEIKNFNNLPADEMNANFFGIKIGDLNGSVNPSNLLGADDRSFTDEITFKTANQQLKAGEEYSIEFTSDEIAQIVGYQFTLNFDPTQLEFVEVHETKVTSPKNFGFALLDEGVLTASWNSLEDLDITEEDAVFHLTFRAKTDGQLSDFLKINSRYTVAEAYPKKDGAISEEIWAINLAFEENGHIFATQELNLYQNKPNPFADHTIIGFDLPQNGRATLTIYDLTGKLLYAITDDFAAGYHEIEVRKADLGASGVLIYRIETDKDSAVRKMLVE